LRAVLLSIHAGGLLHFRIVLGDALPLFLRGELFGSARRGRVLSQSLGKSPLSIAALRSQGREGNTNRTNHL
jgi:hypothetical protein